MVFMDAGKRRLGWEAYGLGVVGYLARQSLRWHNTWDG
jgi:hypothetical protein